MSTTVCQGLESCLEAQPFVLKHKLSLPSNNENEGVDYIDSSSLKSSKKSGGWSFIQALSNPSNNGTAEEVNQKVYVHPLAKRSASALSTKSLEMCTESLGCETGSDITKNDELLSLSFDKQKMHGFSSIPWEEKTVNQSAYPKTSTEKLNGSRKFPPPLTSFSGVDGGGGGVQVIRPHREGGRLVIKAVAISSSHTNFQADRTNGRLKLSLVKECLADPDTNETNNEQNGDIRYNVKEEGDQEVVDHVNCNGLSGEEEEIDEVKGGNVGRDNEIGELDRPSRCKENGRGSKGMSSWGPFWVAIS